MKSHAPEMAQFNEALRQIMTVTKPELTALLHDATAIEGVRQKRGPKPKDGSNEKRNS